MDTFENKDPMIPDSPETETFEADIPVCEPAQMEEHVCESVQPEAPVCEPAQPEAPVYAPEEPPVQPSAYHAKGTGRKESPFANSPYVMQHQPASQAYSPRPEKVRQPRVKKERSGFWKKSLAAVLILALVAGSCAITAGVVNSRWENRMSRMEQQFTSRLDEMQKQITDTGNIQAANAGAVNTGDMLTPSQVYAHNVNSVVAISSTIQAEGFYGPTEGTATGSGFILSENGYVVTNYHVVEGAVAVSVIIHNGTEYPAEIAGFDATNDIAVLKVEAAGLPAATLGSSNALIIGDMVVAIGNPLGELTSTQTVGYVSGKDRDVTTDGSIISMIQTDAAINSGNSGGPLFNMYGEVVGITTAKYSGTTGSGASIEGIGFAIPIDDVKGIISDLVDYGYVTGAYMGITVSNTDESSASMFGLPTGAYVISTEPGGAADRAGIQAKDIIIDLGGHKVTGITSLTRALRNFKAGDTTTVTVIRGGSRLELTITLDEKPGSAVAAPDEDIPMPSDGDYDEWYEYFRKHFGE